MTFPDVERRIRRERVIRGAVARPKKTRGAAQEGCKK
jgi:hypothetical protein